MRQIQNPKENALERISRDYQKQAQAQAGIYDRIPKAFLHTPCLPLHPPTNPILYYHCEAKPSPSF